MKRKFTEFVMVIVILSFAGTVFCDDFIDKAEKVKEVIAKAATGLKNYRIDNDAYPEDGNRNLVSALYPNYVTFESGEISDGLLLDPWGYPYIYERYDPGDNLRWHTYVIYSIGPNGVDEDGNGDDIGNW